jgi:predicted nucleic acid-binding protein
MIAYLDSSVLLRVVLGEPQRLTEWKDIEAGISSALAQVECLRTLDRLRLQNVIPETKHESLRAAVYDLLSRVELVEISSAVLSRASSSIPVPLGTLDAIHLATALLWQDLRGDSLILATHDKALASAARALGLNVIGC